MIKVIKNWVDRYFSDEEAIVLLVLLIAGFAIVMTLGSVLAPVIGSLIVAYLFQGFKAFLIRKHWSGLAASLVSFFIFLAVYTSLILVIFPAVWGQVSQFFAELPNIATKLQSLLELLPEKYPQMFTYEQVNEWIRLGKSQFGQMGQWILSASVYSIPGAIKGLVYLILIPILVFFFIKDGRVMGQWFSSLLPKERRLINRIMHEMDDQIANYVRGKVLEIFIVGTVTYVAFLILGLEYSALLSILVGLSVIIPYIGATVVTIPVALIAYIQWGFSPEFYWTVAVYGVIQALDGNVLVPLIFSEVVNLHPVAIIVAVLVFGGVWGFWGVFFAIPLATLFKAVFTAWPRGFTARELEDSMGR